MSRGRPQVERVTHPCTRCGTPVTKRATDYAKKNSSGQIYCSIDCRRAGPTKPLTVAEKVCEQCQATFRPRRHADVGRFCSKACHDESQRASRLAATCDGCGASFWSKPSWEKLGRRYCTKACYLDAKIKYPTDRVHNGRPVRRDQDGYLWVWEPDHPVAAKSYKGWLQEHRLVAERMIGRPLERADEVHHVNRIRHDNRPENLQVLDGVTHSLISNADKKSDKELLAAYIEKYGPMT